MKNFLSKWIFLNLDELLKQELLHISEPDLVHVDGPPHSPCPSSASFSSSHIPSPELCPVRLQEVNLNKKKSSLRQNLTNPKCLRCSFYNKKQA